MKQLKLIEFIDTHSNWEELLTKEPYNLKITRDGDNIIFKYNQLSSDFSNEIVKESRGIILQQNEDGKFIPVCVPFFKFMNAEEPNSDLNKIDWKTASVQEKVDGSLIKVWYDKKNYKWMVSTNGIIDAFKAPLGIGGFETYGDLFKKATGFNSFTLFTDILNENYTYMFELVSPYNRVVIEYNSIEIYFLGYRDNVTLKEYMPETYLALSYHYPIPERYELHTYEDVKNLANTLPWSQEGFVICDSNFNRVKVKSPEYVKAHFIRNNNVVTDEKLIEIILENEIDEFLIYAKDFEERLLYLKELKEKCINEIEKNIVKLNPNEFSSRKELAQEINTNYPQFMRSFLFNYNKGIEKYNNLNASKWVDLLEKYKEWKGVKENE